MKRLTRSKRFLAFAALLAGGIVLCGVEVFSQDSGESKSLYERVLAGVLRSNAFDQGTMMLTVVTATIALFIGAAMAFLELGWDYIRNVFSSVSKQGALSIANYGSAVRIILLMALIIIYIPMIKALTSTMDLINSFTKPSLSQNASMESWSDRIMREHSLAMAQEIDSSHYQLILERPQEYSTQQVEWAQKELNQGRRSNDEGDGNIGVISAIRGLKFSIVNLGSALVVGLITIIGQVIRVVMMLFAHYTLKIIIVIGPLAIAFSIFRPFEENLERWFKFFLTLGFVFTTINIIDNVNFIFLKQCASLIISGDESQPMLNIVISVINIILYTMPFYLTSLFIGGREGGKILTKTVQVATAATILAMGGRGSVATQGGKGTGGALGKAVVAGGRTIEEN